MSDYDDHDWYEDGECPHCGELRECEHDVFERDEDDEEDNDERRLYLRFGRTQVVAERALMRCGMIPGGDAWLNAFAALVSRLEEQADDPLERRVPGWTVAPPF